MNTRFITEQEILARQAEIRAGAYRARHAFSISGVRHLIGNTFIAMGMLLHGTGEKRQQLTDTSPQAIAALAAQA